MTIQKIEAHSPEAQSANLVADNIEKLKALFPELLTETVVNGQTTAALNVDVLKALVGDATVTDSDEKYGLTWHGTRTARQIALYRLLGWREPSWLHLPLALQCGGLKLSKQNHAPALPVGKESEQLWLALNFLGQAPDPALRHAPTTELLAWAIGHWQPSTIPTQAREVEQ